MKTIAFISKKASNTMAFFRWKANKKWHFLVERRNKTKVFLNWIANKKCNFLGEKQITTMAFFKGGQIKTTAVFRWKATKKQKSIS